MRGTVAKRLREQARNEAPPSKFILSKVHKLIATAGISDFRTGHWEGVRRRYKDLKRWPRHQASGDLNGDRREGE